MKNAARGSKVKGELFTLKSYLKEKSKHLWDEALEMILCYFLSSHTADQILRWSQGTIVHDLLLFFQDHQNFAGIFKVAFPIILFLIWRLIRYWLTRLIRMRRSVQSTRNLFTQIDAAQSSPGKHLLTSHFENGETRVLFSDA